jgi:hypothetical protein
MAQDLNQMGEQTWDIIGAALQNLTGDNRTDNRTGNQSGVLGQLGEKGSDS